MSLKDVVRITEYSFNQNPIVWVTSSISRNKTMYLTLKLVENPWILKIYMEILPEFLWTEYVYSKGQKDQISNNLKWQKWYQYVCLWQATKVISGALFMWPIVNESTDGACNIPAVYGPQISSLVLYIRCVF